MNLKLSPVHFAFAIVLCSSVASAQRPNPVLLQRKADALQEEFLKGLDELATEYEEAGMIDEAKKVLRRRLDVTDDEKAAEKLAELEERDFDLRRIELSIDPNYGWTDTGVEVTEGQEVRIEADGEVRLIFNSVVTPRGLEKPEGTGDSAPGQLIAIIYPPRTGKDKPEPTKPRAVNERVQFEPGKSGRLFLRVAIPEGCKASGSYDVVVSGKISPARPRR